MSARHTASIRVPIDHPALAGHFPGNPVVPGVLVLERVLEAAEGRLGHPLRIRGLVHAKFPAPLLPDAEALATFRIDGGRLEFEVEHAGRWVARGAFELAEGADA